MKILAVDTCAGDFQINLHKFRGSLIISIPWVEQSYLCSKHEILQSESFFWLLRCTQWSMHLRVDSAFNSMPKCMQRILSVMHLKMSQSMETVTRALLLTQVCSRGQDRLSGLRHVEEEEEARSLPNRIRVLRLCFPHLKVCMAPMGNCNFSGRITELRTPSGVLVDINATNFSKRLIY